MIELRHLRTLAAIAEHGTLAAAATEICVSQSALSHQLKDLEAKLGKPLMNRRLNPVVFTREGQRLLELAAQVLPLVDRTCDELLGEGAELAPRLHLVLECHSCFRWLLPVIHEYRAAWPDVDVDIRLGAQFDPWPGLRRGKVDLVITSDPFESTELEFVPLFRYQVMLLVAPDHALAGREWVEPADLAGEDLVTYPVELRRLDVYSRFLKPARIELGQTRAAELTAMIAQQVACGKGVAALPSFALQEIESLQLEALRLGEDGLWATLYAATRRDDAARPHLRAFLKTAYEACLKYLDGVTPA